MSECVREAESGTCTSWARVLDRFLLGLSTLVTLSLFDSAVKAMLWDSRAGDGVDEQESLLDMLISV